MVFSQVLVDGTPPPFPHTHFITFVNLTFERACRIRHNRQNESRNKTKQKNIIIKDTHSAYPY